MKVALDQFTLKTALARIQGLFYGFAILTVLGLLGEFFSGQRGVSFFFWAGVIIVSLKSFHQVLLNFQYSFWSFAFCLVIYIVVTIVGTDSGFVANCYSIALVMLVLLCLMVSSPLFYPRITWWEYDFRFRGELKISACINGKNIPGRLTDLRRRAGCVVLFEKLSPGTELTINYEGRYGKGKGKKQKVDDQGSDGMGSYSVKIISRRGSILGRGYTYGVKFLFLKDRERGQSRFEALSNLWKVTKKAKRLAKFKNIS